MSSRASLGWIPGCLSSLLVVSVVVGLCIGCGGEAAAPERDVDAAKAQAEPKSVVLTLYCGAGIRPAADALISGFEAKHANVKIRPTYAGSEMLLGQIDASGKGDIFMPGAESYVDRAIEMGLADGATRRDAAYFVPVMFVQKGNPKGVLSLDDLKRDGLRIGLGDERSCAVGKQTVKIFEKNGIAYSDVERGVHFKSATVNELPMQIQLGNLDVVIAWDANARHFLNDGDIVPIPSEQNVISTVPLVVLKSSVSPSAAMSFVDFVVSEEGKAIWESHEYTVEPPK